MKARAGRLFLMLLFLSAICSTCGVFAAAKTNSVKFSQKFSDKLKTYSEDGDTYIDQVETWSWSFSGKVFGDFSADEFFQDDTELEIIIGDFTTGVYFLNISDIKDYVAGSDLDLADPIGKKEQKMRGKVKLDTGKGAKNKGSITYNVLFSWEGTVPDNSDKDAPVLFKKTGTITATWDVKGLVFNLKCNIGTADAWNGADDPLIPVEIEPLENPVSPDEKPVTNKKNTARATSCQVRFGSKIYSSQSLGYAGKQLVQLIYKGPKDEKEAIILNSHAVKEVKGTTEIEEPPLAVPVNDAGTAFYGVMLDVDVLGNDISQVEGDELLVSSIEQQPEKGIAVISADQSSIEYTPAADFVKGVDSFTYTIVDSLGRAGQNPATVYVYVGVEDGNRYPMAVSDSATTAISTKVIIDVSANDADQDGDPLTIVSVGQPEFGKTDIKNNKIEYSPNTGYLSEEGAPDYFEYTVSDNKGGVSSGEVFVYVGITDPNVPPVAVEDNALTQINKMIIIDVLTNDTDENLNMLEVVGVSDPGHGIAEADGVNVYYTPDPGYAGTDSFTYIVSDANGGTDTGTVTVRVNTPPVAHDDVAIINADTSSDPLNVLKNDIDADGDTLNVTAITQPKNGTVEQNGNTVTYEPAAGFTGIDSFIYDVADGNGGEAEGYVTIFVGVAFANNDPDAVDDNAIAEMNIPVTIEVGNNDTDPDGDLLRVISVTQGTNGGVEYDSVNVTYTPVNGFVGADTFTYTVSDGKGGTDTATVTVSVNTPPFAVPDTVSTPKGVPVTISVLDNDYDADGDTLSVVAVSNPDFGTAVISGNNIIYTPPGEFTGADTFFYTVSDGRGGTDLATVTVIVE